MAAVLDRVKPLAALLAQADFPVALAVRLCDRALAGAEADELADTVADAVTDSLLVRSNLTWCGVLTTAGAVTPAAAVLFGQAAAMLEADAEAGYQLVLTVPEFLRGALAQLIDDVGEGARPIETTRALRETAKAAGSRLQIAAPFLHAGFVGLLATDVGRVLADGGDVQVLTRAVSLTGRGRSSANADAVALLRSAAAGKPGRLTVSSWEESGLGLHLKVVLAHREDAGPLAYIGSSNPTPGGTLAHAEAGVLAHGPQVKLLSRWLDRTADELQRRRLLPS